LSGAQFGGWTDAEDVVEVERMTRVFQLLQRFLSVAAAITITAAPALAAGGSTGTVGNHHRSHNLHHRSRRASGPVPMYHAALLEDADTGRVLYADNASLVWPPASMAKMMLLLVASDQIAAGRVSYTTPVRISERSAETHGSRLGLHAGDVYPLGELMKAALIKSANDAAVAVAEGVGGSVESTVRMMNEKAQSLDMKDTEYQTVDGLPPRPDHDVDRTSPIDLAILARTLIHTTNLLRWSGMETALFDGGAVVLHNTNHLVGHYEGCDGLKTGFTVQAGFNLTGTAQRGNMRLVSVILGAPSNQERFIQTQKLLDWGFNNFAKVQVLKRGEALPVHVQVDRGPAIQPVPGSDLALVLRKSEVPDLKLQYSVPPMVSGPIALGAPLGQVVVLDGGDVMTRVDVVSPVAVGSPSEVLPPVTIRADDTNTIKDSNTDTSTQENR
jgi:D-alanyl-D-alanine carboxypeptidase (penicillin-binding protein 5/6)